MTILISSAAAWGWSVRERLVGRAALALVVVGMILALGGVGRRLV